MRARWLGLVPVLVLGVLAPGRPAGAESTCADLPPERQMSDEGIGLTSGLGLPPGRYALPAAGPPSTLVLFLHGYGNDSCAWRNHLRAAAARGAVAVAMDYTGQDPLTRRGWFVREGAEDTILAAKHFLGAFPSLRRVFVLGISMGGNASGMLVASPNARRPDGSPLVDGWVAVEGVHDLAQEYLIARAVAPGNALAAQATEDIEREAGGPVEARPDAYRELTNVARAPDMAANGLRAAVLVHGVDDGLVPTNQSREMATALRAVGVPVELYTVLGRGDGEAGTTASGIVAGPVLGARGEPYESPLAGHGWEGSDTQLVIRTGFAQLWALVAGKPLSPYREFVVHGEGLVAEVP